MNRITWPPTVSRKPTAGRNASRTPIQAARPTLIRGSSSSAMVPRHALGHPAGDLVLGEPGPRSVLGGADPATQQRDLIARHDGEIADVGDRDVHRDRADQHAAATVDHD